ncbi:hypothetical protein GGR56DRAFT_330164 [Xylariaceae sp. FL0804]|nr:hypothetical protein GGR56DRAFT_330164 [Xylariaceae sp. FL0804]
MEALCLELKRRVDALLERPAGSGDDGDDDDGLRAVQDQVRVARGVVEEALRRYRPEELSLSYNGGKDCLVLLILILASLPTVFPPSSSSSTASSSTAAAASSSSSSSPSSFPPSLQALYIRPPRPFAEVDAFVAASAARYGLDLATADDAGMKAALTRYLAARPRVRAVFVGTRRTDPHGARLAAFDPTDPGWPPFMRVHPVIDWHYREIWGFIRALEIPYCELYDMGYTSLGGTDDTHPNPALRLKGSSDGFRPAYELMEDDEERLGRDR